MIGQQLITISVADSDSFILFVVNLVPQALNSKERAIIVKKWEQELFIDVITSTICPQIRSFWLSNFRWSGKHIEFLQQQRSDINPAPDSDDIWQKKRKNHHLIIQVLNIAYPQHLSPKFVFIENLHRAVTLIFGTWINNTERTWWYPPKLWMELEKKHRCGVWTTLGPRHSPRGPTWATGSLPTSIPYPSK